MDDQPRTLSRTLLRFVFPQFALRLTLVLAVIAVSLIALTRSFQLEQHHASIERDALIVESILIAERGASPHHVEGLLNHIVQTTGLAIGVFDEGGAPLYVSEGTLAPIVRRTLENVEATGAARLYPDDGDGDRFTAIRRLPQPGWTGARYVAVAGTEKEIRNDLEGMVVFLGAIVLFILVLVLLITYRVVAGINTPLKELRHAAGRFAEGQLEYRAALSEPRELVQLAETMNEMACQLQGRIASIRSQQTQLEAILGNMVEGVILVDQQIRVRSMNAAARRLFQVRSITTSTGEARTLLEVIRNSELYEFVLRTDRSEKSEEASIVIYTNPPRYMQVHGTAMELGTEHAILVVLNDITRLKELEDIRREFVANVSHELKTPITSILGFVETIVDGEIDDPDEIRRFLTIVSNQTHRLNAIIEDLLQLSRLEQRNEEIDRESTRAEEIVAAVRQTVESSAEEKGIKIADTYRGGTTFPANANLIQQALTNLVDNAIKYCPAGSEVQIAFEITPETTTITVSDDGPGISPSDQARVFERFYRTDKARSRSLGGTGLGLAIVKHIAHAHHGTVHLHSTLGEGSSFTISLPNTGSPSDQPQSDL